MRLLLWSTRNGDTEVNIAPVNNYEASADPTANDDSGDQYTRGSVWINGGKIFMCADATAGAANWVQIGPVA